MPIEFRCTGCRAKLHVPSRWAETSIACPKCSSRVMVPSASPEGVAKRFEDRSVEKSIESLLVSPQKFEKTSVQSEQKGEPVAAKGQVSFPRIWIYLQGGLIFAVACLGFALGAWIFSSSPM